MAGIGRNDIGFADGGRREDGDRMEKAARIGALIVVAAIAAIGLRMLACSGSAQEFSIEKAGTSQASDARPETPESPVDTVEAAASAPPDAQKLSVYMSGAVAQPGVYEVAAGSRVIDAVDAAGGLAQGARPETVNLARRLQDGEHVHIPGEGDPTNAPDQAQAGGEGASQLVNINTAGESELEALPGIGPATARKIVAEREANGAFSSVDDLSRVSGIGAKKIEGLRDSACV